MSTKNLNTIKMISTKMKKYFGFIVAGIILIYFVFNTLIGGEIRKYLLINYSIEKNAVIINEKNHWGNHLNQSSLSYFFIVDNQHYSKDSRKQSLKVGDSVLIHYVSFYPKISKFKKKIND